MANCNVFYSVFYILCLCIINLLSYKMFSAAYIYAKKDLLLLYYYIHTYTYIYIFYIIHVYVCVYVCVCVI